VGLERVVDPTRDLVARLRGPDHWVVNVLGIVVPDAVILYLFFFIFSWVEGGPVLKMVAVAHHASPLYQHLAFFWPHPVIPPCPTVRDRSPEWG